MIRLAPALAAASLCVAACAPASSHQAGTEVGATQISPIIPAMPRQRIVLMSSLPLVYGAGVDMAAVIAGKAHPHPLHRELIDAHDLIVPDTLDGSSLKGARLAILVQPRVLAPHELVALDAYVRGGGRLMLFADPLLGWPHGAGLAEAAGPVRSALISPLLAHWGLELVDPGIETSRLGKSGPLMIHPGQFRSRQGKIGDAVCRLESSSHVARCQVGRGMAVLVADADLLDPDILERPDESARSNRQWVRNLMAHLVTEDSS